MRQLVICEDADDDGTADEFTVFADGLSIPHSIVAYGDGVILAEVGTDEAGRVVYLGDEDGDSYGALINLHELQESYLPDPVTDTEDWTERSFVFNSEGNDSLLFNLLFGGWGFATGTLAALIGASLLALRDRSRRRNRREPDPDFAPDDRRSRSGPTYGRLRQVSAIRHSSSIETSSFSNAISIHLSRDV